MYLAYQYFNGLNQLPEMEVYGFPHSDLFNRFYTKNLFNKITYKLYPNYIFSTISKNLEATVEKYQPDVLLLFKGMEISAKVLSKIKQKGVKLVNYNLDHPFEFASRGSGNKNVLDALPLYDMHISYSHRIIQQLKDRLPTAQTAYLPFGYALNDEDYQLVDQQHQEINRVCFIGEPDAIRVNLIKQLVDAQIPMELFGRNWDHHLQASEYLKINRSAYGIDYWHTLRRFRVQLNIFRPHNKGSHNMRSFEVPAAGGIMLAPRTEEHLAAFEEGKEAFFYDTLEEATKTAKQLLNLNPETVTTIRDAARQRSQNSGYSYPERAKQLYHFLSKLIN